MVRKVIKADATVEPSAASAAVLGDRKVIDREVFGAQQEAEKIKQAAEQKAQQRRERGAQEAQAAYQQAHDEGGADGLRQVAAAAIQGYHRRGETLREAVDDCITIARQICAKVMGSDLRLDEAEIRRISEAELQRTVTRRQVTLNFGPERLAALEQQAPRLWAATTAQPEFCLGADPAMAEERAQVQSDVGAIDVEADPAEAMLRELLGVPVDSEPTNPAEPDAESGAEPPAAGYQDIADLVAEVDAEEEGS